MGVDLSASVAPVASQYTPTRTCAGDLTAGAAPPEPQRICLVGIPHGDALAGAHWEALAARTGCGGERASSRRGTASGTAVGGEHGEGAASRPTSGRANGVPDAAPPDPSMSAGEG